MHSNTLRKKNPTCTQARAFISFDKQINSRSISKITSCFKKVFCDDEKENEKEKKKIDTYTHLFDP